jgi:hypothetical protein
MILYYKLDENKNPVPCGLEGLKEVLQDDRIVKQEYVGDKWVSTVFLSIDHNFMPRELYPDARPLLFETMVFKTVDGEEDLRTDIYQCRYHTWDESVAGHDAVVELIKQGLPLYDEEA